MLHLFYNKYVVCLLHHRVIFPYSQVQQSSEYEEDDFSVNIHIKVLQEECKKRHQNDDIIRDKMDRTFLHRAKYITTHSVTETLTCFPPLQQTNEVYSVTITANLFCSTSHFTSSLKNLTTFFSLFFSY